MNLSHPDMPFLTIFSKSALFFQPTRLTGKSQATSNVIKAPLITETLEFMTAILWPLSDWNTLGIPKREKIFLNGL